MSIDLLLDIEDDLLSRLQELATLNNRSVEQEVKAILTKHHQRYLAGKSENTELPLLRE